MSIWDRSVAKTVTATADSGAGGNTTCTVTVPPGEAWEILHGLVYHNDGAGRTGQWGVLAAIVAAPKAAIAASIPLFLYSPWDVTEHHPGAWVIPLRLNSGQTLSATFQALAAAKTVTVILHVRFIRGAPGAV